LYRIFFIQERWWRFKWRRWWACLSYFWFCFIFNKNIFL